MKIKLFRHFARLVLFNAALLVAAGCATSKRSYNDDYGQNLPTSPKYVVENQNDSHFKITVTQGSPATGAQRAIYLKEAAATIAKTEATKRGWQSWDIDYIQERDNGWQHIIVGEVTRRNSPQLKSNP